MMTDNMLNAVEMIVNQCKNQSLQEGMETLLEMLLAFDETEWNKMSEEERNLWVKEFLPE